MTANSILNLSEFQPNYLLSCAGRKLIGRCLCGVTFFLAATLLVSVSAAQETAAKLVPGSEVSLSAVKAADWIQGEGPSSFEPGKVYVFECWATWCPPCIGLIPHVNELHKKYYDKGLRVHGMSWENDRDLVKKFVDGKGEGMSYPVGLVVEGSSFEKEYLTAAGVESIPHAFVVKDGKLLFGAGASRLTDSLIEMVLSGDEGIKKAAAIIQAAFDNEDKVEAMYSEFAAIRNADDKEAKLNEVLAIDSGYYQIPKMKFDVLVLRKDWSAIAKGLMEMPSSQSKTTFLLNLVRKMEVRGGGQYSPELVKVVAKKYTEYVEDGGERIGPNHFASLAGIHGMADDKEAAIKYANMGVEVSKKFVAGKSEARTEAFKRFAKSVSEGTIPKVSQLSKWQRELRAKAKAAK